MLWNVQEAGRRHSTTAVVHPRIDFRGGGHRMAGDAFGAGGGGGGADIVVDGDGHKRRIFFTPGSYLDPDMLKVAVFGRSCAFKLIISLHSIEFSPKDSFLIFHIELLWIEPGFNLLCHFWLFFHRLYLIQLN